MILFFIIISLFNCLANLIESFSCSFLKYFLSFKLIFSPPLIPNLPNNDKGGFYYKPILSNLLKSVYWKGLRVEMQ